ncbi:MAG: heavy-metal-associated domain-containing protein [Bacteroidales bacterium]|nr:heavy-metal-associated domain-containing protein [Bacteroidales bacterium]
MKRILIMAVAAMLLAAPAVMAQKPQNQKAKTEKKVTQDKNAGSVTFSTNMTCKNCVKKVNENLSFEKGVKDLDVSLEEQKITITYDKRKTDEEKLAASIKKLGYKAEKVK